MGLISSQERQVRIESLREFHSVLGRVLSGAGLSQAECAQVLSQHISARCVLCGMRLSSHDLGQIPPPDWGAPGESSKLKRISQGYCARRNCTSYYYEIELKEHPKLDWNEVLSQMDAPPPAEAPAPETPAEIESEPPGVRAARKQFRIKVAVSIAFVLFVLLYRHWMAGGSIPFIRPKHYYTIAPSSLVVPPK